MEASVRVASKSSPLQPGSPSVEASMQNPAGCRRLQITRFGRLDHHPEHAQRSADRHDHDAHRHRQHAGAVPGTESARLTAAGVGPGGGSSITGEGHAADFHHGGCFEPSAGRRGVVAAARTTGRAVAGIVTGKPERHPQSNLGSSASASAIASSWKRGRRMSIPMSTPSAARFSPAPHRTTCSTHKASATSI